MPDTSVLVDGRITELVLSGEFPRADIRVPRAALAELEAQANRGLESGVAGLDELAALQEMAKAGQCTIEFAGDRPHVREVMEARSGAIDARIRELAVEVDAIFVTSDRIQAHAAAAQGLRHHYLRPRHRQTDLTTLKLWEFFDPETMSVHLKSECVPMVKRGQPGAVRYEPHRRGATAMPHKDLRAIQKECLEFARRDDDSFIEMEKHGCTVIQLGPMRITMAQPPFADGLELTAVRPITKKSIEHYKLDRELFERIEGHSRGVFIAGPPGSGKSTFAAAVAEHLHGLARVVKTMEQPRDLQVPREVTQYGALDRDMKWTGDVILLVRPDHVLYDEVRTTEDFRVFADMRLAGVGLIGVTHANRAIDAVQRLIGRVELGMIPQIVDTVLFVEAGKIAQVLELTFTVKVPSGMTDADLARPVVLVTDVRTARPVFELYTYGEQVVVMPLDQEMRKDPASQLAERQLSTMLRKYVQGRMEVQVRGNRATVMVPESEVPGLIGKGGRNVQMLENKLGIGLQIQALPDRPTGRWERKDAKDDYQEEMEAARAAAKEDDQRGGVRIKRTGTNVFVLVGTPGLWRIEVEGAVVGEGIASKDGKVRFKAKSAEGEALVEATKRGFIVSAERLED
ncbi:MAG: ATPase [Thermoplasmata archaeon]|nr:ATPase [Thermoplasmata archaeon]